MTHSEEIQATLAGSYIQALVAHTGRWGNTKGSVIKLRQHLAGKLGKGRKHLAQLANDTYLETAKSFEEDIAIDIGMVIETLYFNHEEAMKSLFGSNTGDLVVRAAAKITLDNLDEKQQKDSYIAADAFTKTIRKNVYNHIKG